MPTRSPAAGSLLELESLSSRDITDILKQAKALARAPRTRLLRKLAGRRIALLFYEASTRTRISFEYAAKNLGAVTAVMTSAGSSIEKGESLIDTGYTLEATGAECIIMRHPNSGAAELLARNVRVPVINAGDGMHEHPSQGLLDAYTILQHKRSLKGLRVVIVGDIRHSRVARSNVQLLSKFGAEIVLCGPEPLLPATAATLAKGVTIERDFDRALHGADVVMMLRVQKERLAGLSLDVADYIRGYQLDGARMAKAKKDAVFMHPGPIIRGMELTAEAADAQRSLIVEQVANGVPVRMALLVRAFA
jgi:aspartate carbamoyltransferase catalytic subunit